MGLGFIRPGDKVDIHFLHQDNGKIYKSSVYNVLNDIAIEIIMPIDEGKVVMLNSRIEYQLYIYASAGVYTGEAVVFKQYKRDNFFLICMKLKNGVKKFQRREFYRVESLVDFAYYKIPDEVAELESTDDLFHAITSLEYMKQKKLARTRDISAGGIRFTAEESLEIGSHILPVLHLVNDKMDHTFYLVAEVISCDPSPQAEDRWVVRAQWKYKDIRDRDLIVSYVFEEDRTKRKKENG